MKEGYKNTELGMIPNDWDIKSTGEIFEFSGGLSISREKLTNDGINYLHYGDIHKRTENFIDVDLDEKWLPKLSEDFELIRDTVKLNDGDVVFADASEDYDGIGKSVAILNRSNKPFVSGLHTIIGKDNNNILDRNFKRFCFSLNSVRLQFRKLATGTSVYGISRENIKKINILVPPLKEQEKIAEILSVVDSQINDTVKLIEKIKELKKGLMKSLLTKGIGHTEFKKSEIGEIPIEWKVYKLKEVTERMIVGLATSVTQYYRENGVPIIRNKNIKYCKFDDSDMLYLDKDFAESQISKTVNTNDVITVHTGSNLGLTCLVPQEYQGSHTFTTLITTVDKDIIYPSYLMYHINSEDGIKEIDRLQVGGGKNNLNVKEFELYRMAVPNTVLEQKNIVDILSSVDAQIEEYENKKMKLEKLKKGLMQQLLTGKIRVI